MIGPDGTAAAVGWDGAAAAVKKTTAAKMQIAGIAAAKTARETANLSITLIKIPWPSALSFENAMGFRQSLAGRVLMASLVKQQASASENPAIRRRISPQPAECVGCSP
jgi:hypothetical protein